MDRWKLVQEFSLNKLIVVRVVDQQLQHCKETRAAFADLERRVADLGASCVLKMTKRTIPTSWFLMLEASCSLPLVLQGPAPAADSPLSLTVRISWRNVVGIWSITTTSSLCIVVALQPMRAPHNKIPFFISKIMPTRQFERLLPFKVAPDILKPYFKARGHSINRIRLN